MFYIKKDKSLIVKAVPTDSVKAGQGGNPGQNPGYLLYGLKDLREETGILLGFVTKFVFDNDYIAIDDEAVYSTLAFASEKPGYLQDIATITVAETNKTVTLNFAAATTGYVVDKSKITIDDVHPATATLGSNTIVLGFTAEFEPGTYEISLGVGAYVSGSVDEISRRQTDDVEFETYADELSTYTPLDTTATTLVVGTLDGTYTVDNTKFKVVPGNIVPTNAAHSDETDKITLTFASAFTAGDYTLEVSPAAYAEDGEIPNRTHELDFTVTAGE